METYVVKVTKKNVKDGLFSEEPFTKIEFGKLIDALQRAQSVSVLNRVVVTNSNGGIVYATKDYNEHNLTILPIVLFYFESLLGKENETK